MLLPKAFPVARMVRFAGRTLLVLALFDLLVVAAYRLLHWEWVATPHLPLGLYGSALGLIVAFRNNSAYARWWEARQLWGAIVNNSRSLVRQASTTLRARAGSSQDAQALAQTLRRITLLQIAWVHALRQHLRQLPPWDELTRLLPASEVESLRDQRNVPLRIQRLLGDELRRCLDAGWTDALGWQAMDRNLDDLADAQGGCERIKNTPMPAQYDALPRLFVQIFCLLLPLGLVQDMGWLTPLGSSVVGFMFVALDRIGRDLEDPFDNTVFDVPMTALSLTIETNLRQLIADPTLPEPEPAREGVLW